MHPQLLRLQLVAQLPWILRRDACEGFGCIHCGYRTGLFSFRGKLLSICPNCTAARIALLRDAGYPIPDGRGRRLRPSPRDGEFIDYDGRGLAQDLAVLEDEALLEVDVQDWREKRALTVDFDIFAKCFRCEKLVLKQMAQCVSNPAEGYSAPHCGACAGILRSQQS
jgi:hypothetical protein